MSQIDSSATEASSKRIRKTQNRAEITRAKLIDAGALLFSERGFDAVSISDLETAAGVKRNVLTHHFGNKETLWRASADALYQEWESEFDKRLSLMKEITDREALAFLVRFQVYFASENPRVSLLFSKEAIRHSWRLEYLTEHYYRRNVETMEKWVNNSIDIEHDAFVHWYYIMTNAAASVFVLAPHCQTLFGVDPNEESIIDAHVEMMVSLLLPGD